MNPWHLDLPEIVSARQRLSCYNQSQCEFGAVPGSIHSERCLVWGHSLFFPRLFLAWPHAIASIVSSLGVCCLTAKAEPVNSVFVIAMENHNWTQPISDLIGAASDIQQPECAVHQ